MSSIFFFILTFILSFILTFVIRKIAIKKSFIDFPNRRSSHINPTPLGGGVAVCITWFSGLTYLYFSQNINTNLYFALMSGIIIAIIGAIDDFIGIHHKKRF